MCLITYDKKAKTAGKPVTCYKVARKVRGGFKSECQDFRYDAGVEYSLEPGIYFPLTNVAHPAQWPIQYGFHSYARLIDATAGCCEYEGISGSDADDGYLQVILRCEIPAGSFYWEGSRRGLYYREYCSNRIKVTGWKFRGEKEWRTETLNGKQ